MSVTINIAGKQAVLADGKWRSANSELAELLNLQLATLELPAHYPPADLELRAAQAAANDFQGEILSIRRIPNGPSHTADGRQTVFKGGDF